MTRLRMITEKLVARDSFFGINHARELFPYEVIIHLPRDSTLSTLPYLHRSIFELIEHKYITFEDTNSSLRRHFLFENKRDAILVRLHF